MRTSCYMESASWVMVDVERLLMVILGLAD